MTSASPSICCPRGELITPYQSTPIICHKHHHHNCSCVVRFAPSFFLFLGPWTEFLVEGSKNKMEDFRSPMHLSVYPHGILTIIPEDCPRTKPEEEETTTPDKVTLTVSDNNNCSSSSSSCGCCVVLEKKVKLLEGRFEEVSQLIGTLGEGVDYVLTGLSHVPVPPTPELLSEDEDLEASSLPSKYPNSSSHRLLTERTVQDELTKLAWKEAKKLILEARNPEPESPPAPPSRKKDKDRECHQILEEKEPPGLKGSETENPIDSSTGQKQRLKKKKPSRTPRPRQTPAKPVSTASAPDGTSNEETPQAKPNETEGGSFIFGTEEAPMSQKQECSSPCEKLQPGKKIRRTLLPLSSSTPIKGRSRKHKLKTRGKGGETQSLPVPSSSNNLSKGTSTQPEGEEKESFFCP